MAVLCAGLATCASWWMDPWPGVSFVFFPFYLAVMVMTLMGDWKHALLTALLSAFAAGSFFLVFRAGPNSTDPEFDSGMVVFLVISASIIGRVELQRAARRKTDSLIVQLQNEISLHRKTESTLAAQEEEKRLLHAELESRVEERTRQLQAANHEMEAFAYSVSHDLRAPLRGVVGFAEALKEDYEGRMDEVGRDYLNRLIQSGCEMDRLIEDLLHLSRLTRAEMKCQSVDLSLMGGAIFTSLRSSEPQRRVICSIEPGMSAMVDSRLMRVALENLLNNAWKFSNQQPEARIEFGIVPQPGEKVYFVRDNGVGFNMTFANKLFGPFQRLHSTREFPGHGLGLATAQRIIHRHGGRIWAKSEPGQGASFYFTLPGVT